MTVAELIEKLSQMPQDVEVTMLYDGGHGENSVEVVSYSKTYPDHRVLLGPGNE